MKNFFSKKAEEENPFLEKNMNKGDETDNMAQEVTETENNEEIKNEVINENAEETENLSEEEKADESDDKSIKLQEELDELNNKYLRLAADFDNYRKRQVQEREALLKYGAEECMKKVIEVVDNFDRAMQSIEIIEDIDKMKETFFVLNKQLMDSLTKLGLEQIKSVGEKFDPNMHEAVMQTKTEEYPEETIIKELQKGYKMGDKVLRPAMVDVAVQ